MNRGRPGGHLGTAHGRRGRRATPSLMAREWRRAMLGAFAYLAAAPQAPRRPLGSLLIVSIVPAFHGVTSRGWRGLRARRRAVPR